MRKIKIVSSVALIFILCFGFCACGSDKENLVGTWAGAWEFMGNQISCSFVVSENGQYFETTLKNGDLNSLEAGTWEFRDEKLLLHINGDLYSSTVYEYKNGKLINNEHEFVKQGI